MSLHRDFSLYNGVSNRSRGWKSRKGEKVEECDVFMYPSIRRWDGASRSSAAWDYLRRDPELWFRDGDCYVHLYEKGQSRRGPAFKVPLNALLEANCLPLVQRSVSQNTNLSLSLGSISSVKSHRRTSLRPHRIDLYVPVPQGSDKEASFKYHVATRNFFAWVVRRSLVGEHLGVALTNLMDSMNKFRPRDANNVDDIMSYMDEEGYMCMRNQPTHALALLYFAEMHQLRDLYINAFAHCCGMSDHLFLNPNYHLISSVTRKLLRHARVEMDLRLGQAGSMLECFLQDELSEAHLGLHPGARAHLDRFRTLLQGLYAARFGYYPPPSIDSRTTIFDADVLRTMRSDFEALFLHLVDETSDLSQGMPAMAQGGICTFQSVTAFDERHNFSTLPHPLPQLPEIGLAIQPRRMSWLGMGPKKMQLNVRDRANTHVALLKATNQERTNLFDNSLVRAYRKFEEDSVYSPLKADKQESLNVVDARKVRWILIYTAYQTLLQATQTPPEVDDADDVPYHLCISTRHLPPWDDQRPLRSLRQQLVSTCPSISTSGFGGSTECLTPTSIPEIKPDIDYLAIRDRLEKSEDKKRPVSVALSKPTRSKSIPGTMTRSSSVRRSLSIFRRKEVEKTPPPTARRAVQYHEILVHGYGNGTNDVEFTNEQPSSASAPASPSKKGDVASTNPNITTAMKDVISMASRSSSTASSSSRDTQGSNSDGGTADTANTSICESPTSTLMEDKIPSNVWTSRRKTICVRSPARNGEFNTVPARNHSVCLSASPALKPRPQSQAIDSQSKKVRRSMTTPIFTRMGSLSSRAKKSAPVSPTSIRDNDDGSPLKRQLSNKTIWDDVMALANNDTKKAVPAMPWEMYNDLGGLRELKNQ